MVEVERLSDSITLYKVGVINYYVVEGEETVIYECGLSCSAEKLLEELEVEPDYVIIPHGHFDHVGGAVVFKEVYPDVKIVGHPALSKLAEKEKVQNAWKNDNNALCRNFFKEEGYEDGTVEIDIQVSEGDVVGELEIIETPGHSKDCISAYFRKDNAVFVNDSLGFALSSNEIIPMFFHSFDDYYKSIKKIQALKPYILGLSHNLYVKGRMCDEFIENSLSETVNLFRKLKSHELSDDELVEYAIRGEMKYYPEKTMKPTVMVLKKRVEESNLEL